MNIQQIMKQAKQMQKKMEEAQAKLAESRYEGKAGGGMVSITINGKGEMLEVKLDAAALDPSDPEMLEDLIVAAFNAAKKQADDAAGAAMGSLTGGMGLPSGFKMPF